MTAAQLPEPHGYEYEHQGATKLTRGRIPGLRVRNVLYTADQLREAIATARREAMEECLLIAECADIDDGSPDWYAGARAMSERIEAAIRARGTP